MRAVYAGVSDGGSPGVRGPVYIANRHHFNVVFDHADPDSALTQALLSLF